MYSFTGVRTRKMDVDERERIVKGIVTAEIVDKQGEITIRDELLTGLQAMLKTSRAMSDTHSNRIVGTWKSFDPITIRDEDGTDVPAIMGVGQIFKGTALYDDIWEKIKTGEYRGFSFGGATKSDRIPVMTGDGRLAYQLKDIEVYEVAVCAEPAVPWALVTYFDPLAKANSTQALEKMGMEERGENVVLRCNDTICYVNRAKACGCETLNTGQAPKTINKMSTKIRKEDEPVEEAPEEAPEEEAPEESESEKAFKAIAQLAQAVVKSKKSTDTQIDRLSKQIAGLSKQIEAGNGSEESDGSEVPLKDDYVDTDESTASPNPQERDAEGSDDKVSIEEKNWDAKRKAMRARIAKRRIEARKAGARRPVQRVVTPPPAQTLSAVLKSTTENPVLKYARQGDGGPEWTADLLKTVLNDRLGLLPPEKPSFGQFYPIG